MERWFTTEQEKRIDVVDHTIEQLNKYPNLKIYIGTDAQDYGRYTYYVTAVVYRYGTNGAHYVYFFEKTPRERIEYTRLYNEGLRTIETHALITDEIPVVVEALEFDFADVKKTLSSQLVNVFKNWGYANATFKSGEMLATKAADHLVREQGKKENAKKKKKNRKESR